MKREKIKFRKESLDTIKSPEKLDEYIKVSNPSIWIILAAILILVAGVCIWSIFGTLPMVYSTAGVTLNDTVYAYVNVEDVEALPFSVGLPVKLSQSVNDPPYYSEITSISRYPKSERQVSERLNDYEIYAMDLSKWVYELEIPVEGYDDHDLAYVQITLEEIRPYTFLIG